MYRIAHPHKACHASLLCNKLISTQADAILLNKLTATTRDHALTLQQPRLYLTSIRICAYADQSRSPQTPAKRHL